MKICPTCGIQVNSSASFCESCGTPIAGQAQAEKPAHTGRGPRKNLHCPECGSARLSPIVESTNNGGVAVSSPVSRRLGVTTYQSTTTHRNYWMCQDCGTKFRNLQNLKEEIASETKRMKSCKTFLTYYGIFCILVGLLCAWNDFMALLLTVPLLLFICAEAIICGVWLTTRNKIVKMMEEKRYLEANCFSRERRGTYAEI